MSLLSQQARRLQSAGSTADHQNFLRLPVMAVIGYLLYAEALDPWTAVGALIIFAGNWYSVREESRRGGSPGGH